MHTNIPTLQADKYKNNVARTSELNIDKFVSNDGMQIIELD